MLQYGHGAPSQYTVTLRSRCAWQHCARWHSKTIYTQLLKLKCDVLSLGKNYSMVESSVLSVGCRARGTLNALCNSSYPKASPCIPLPPPCCYTHAPAVTRGLALHLPILRPIVTKGFLALYTPPPTPHMYLLWRKASPSTHHHRLGLPRGLASYIGTPSPPCHGDGPRQSQYATTEAVWLTVLSSTALQ